MNIEEKDISVIPPDESECDWSSEPDKNVDHVGEDIGAATDIIHSED